MKSSAISNRIVYFLLGAMMIVPNNLYAKLRVTKATQTNMRVTVSKFSRSNYSSSLYCEGYKTYITSDSQGNTLVYVNDDGGDYSTDEKYLVDSYEDGSPVEWSCVDIYGGKEKTSVSNTNIKMVGGNVRSINMMGYSGDATKSANLMVTGGVVSHIRLGVVNTSIPIIQQSSTTINVYLSNLRYSGGRKMSMAYDMRAATVFVNNDCEYYEKTARLTSSDVESCKGAMIPDADDPNKMIAMGAAFVPANTHVECDQFENKATSISFGSGSSIYIRKCNGLVSGSNNISTYSQITQRAHNQIKVITIPATCTRTEYYFYYCDLCGYKSKTYNDKTVHGHNYVSDDAVEATCCSDGLTAGKHCTKCGVSTQTVVPKLGHDYSDYVARTVCSGTIGNNTTSTLIRMCKRCFAMEYKVNPLARVNHDWLFTNSTIIDTGHRGSTGQTNKTLAAMLKKFERTATCTRPGLRYMFCSKCQFVVSEELSPTNHANAVKHEAVAATCEKAGNKAYSDCGKCGLKIFENGQTFNELSDAYIAPIGHKYGGSASYVRSADAKVSDATCESPAVYHQTCANTGCGHISNDLIFYGESSMGHQYHIKTINYKDPEAPEDGILTLRCGKCAKEWPCFEFEISKKVGDVSDGGYWTKCQLVETTKLPTCVPGWGKYRLTLNYKGTRMEAEYENYVTPCGYLHNYDADGVCHEKHYQMKLNSDGSIVKTYAGQIEYVTQKVNDETVLVEDNTVYSTKGYLLKPYQAKVIKQGSMPSLLKDPETDEVMYYTDYRVTQINDQEGMIAAMKSQSEPYYASSYFDWNFYDDDPLYEQYSKGNFPSSVLGFDTHGHKINQIFNTYHIVYKVDGQVYKTVDCKFGSAITPEANPTKEGYTFSGWSEIPATMPKQDVMVTGSFSVNSYKLIYKVDGKEYKTATVTYGSTITPEAAPTKEGHTFSGWSNVPSTMPAKDVTVTGTFKVNSYKLIYKVDGKEYKTTTVAYGSAITPETAPTKEGYTFSGWSTVPSTMPSKDVTVTGSFSVNSYKLIYKVDGKEYKTTTVAYGSTITPETAPTKEGYTFSGWSNVPSTMPSKDVTVTGNFTVNSYKLIYKVDGKEYKTTTVAFGSTITPETAPTKEGYTFSGWSTVPSTMPSKDVTITGSFTVNSYKLIYKVDGKEYKTTTVAYGSTITPETAPTKEGYTFSGWSNVPSTMPSKDVTVTGSFTVNSYKLIYKVDGKEYKTTAVAYGSTITPETAPTKEGYTFSGWSTVPSTMPSKDVTVTGSFTVNSYKLIYKVDGVVYKTETLAFGSSITPATPPAKDGYTFSGWSAIPSTMPAKDVTITGTFSDNSYFLTYKVDGEVYKSELMGYGVAITPEAEPTKEGYTFSGWSNVPSTMPSKDVTVTGTFKVNSYKLIYKVDGKEYKTTTVTYGSPITPEPAPAKEGYEFSGWSAIPATMPAEDVEVVGTFSISVGLESVYGDEKTDVYYDLQGRMIQHPVKGQAYLLNGKRVMYK